MRRVRTIYLLMLSVMTPSLWLAVTTDWTSDTQSTGLAVGSALTGVIVGWSLLLGHRAGRLLPNRCVNCGGGMGSLRPGQLVAMDGGADLGGHRWHCRGCGRLAS